VTLPQPRESAIQQGRITITLPMPSNRANRKGSSHWRGVYRDRGLYIGAAQTHALAQTRVQQRMATASTCYRITATLYVWAMMDDDNAVARLKWPLDALRGIGILFSDKRPYCALAGIPAQVIDRKHQRIELILEPA
jgi:hypothetical protein